MEIYTAAVYIMTNKKNGTLYTGITNNLLYRVNQHKNMEQECFTKRYRCTLLVYYEFHENIVNAIEREKQIKGGNRKAKIKLIESINQEWNDLAELFF